MADAWIADPTGEDFYRAARLALDADDVALALERTAAALSFDPLSERYLHLLDLVLSRTKRPLECVEPKGELFFGKLAVRAHILARERRLGDAVVALAEVVLYRPGVPYLPWAVRWVQGARTARGIRADQALADFSRILEADGVHPDNLSAASWLIERVASERPRVGAALSALRARLDRRLAEVSQVPERRHPVAQLLVTEQLDAAAELLRAVSTDPGVSGANAAFAAYLSARRAPTARGSLPDLEQALAALGPSPIHALLRRRVRAYRTEIPPLGGRLAAVLRDALYRAARAGERSVRIRIVGEPTIPRSALFALQAGLRDLSIEGAIEHDGERIELANLSDLDAPHARQIEAAMVGKLDLDALVRRPILPISAARDLLSHPPSPPCGRDPVDRLHLAQVVSLGLCVGASEPQAVWDCLHELVRDEDVWLGSAAIAVLAAQLRALGPGAPDSWRRALADGFGVVSVDDPRARVLASAQMATGVLQTDDERRAAAERFEHGLAPIAGS